MTMLLAVGMLFVQGGDALDDEVRELFRELAESYEDPLKKYSKVVSPDHPRLRGALLMMESSSDAAIQRYARAIRSGALEVVVVDPEYFKTVKRTPAAGFYDHRRTTAVHINGDFFDTDRLEKILVHESEHAFDPRLFDGYGEARAFLRESRFASEWGLPPPAANLRYDRIRDLPLEEIEEIVEKNWPKNYAHWAGRRASRLNGAQCRVGCFVANPARSRALRRGLHVLGWAATALDAALIARKLARGESIRDDLISIGSYAAAGLLVAGGLALAGATAPIWATVLATAALGYGIEQGIRWLLNRGRKDEPARRRSKGRGTAGARGDGFEGAAVIIEREIQQQP